MSPEPKSETSQAGQVRLFIAITVPDAVRTELRRLQGELKELLPPPAAAWTKPESLHLTLRFLGNVEATRLPELSQRFRIALAGFGELDLVGQGLGCFPDLRFPRVVWAGVRDEANRLQQLYRRVDAAVRDFAEKPAAAEFVGHITLARLKRMQRRDAELLARWLDRGGPRRFGAWRTDTVTLFRSHLAATGAVHEELLRAGLGKPTSPDRA